MLQRSSERFDETTQRKDGGIPVKQKKRDLLYV
jgi:hypothetical protein